MRLVIAYVAVAATFLALDALWLGFVARDLYRSQIGHLLAPDFRVGPAAAFYAFYVAGVVYFAVSPTLASGAWWNAALPAALLGALCYGTYDFTSWAVMRDWPAAITFVDIGWGIVLTTLAACAGAFAASHWG